MTYDNLEVVCLRASISFYQKIIKGYFFLDVYSLFNIECRFLPTKLVFAENCFIKEKNHKSIFINIQFCVIV